MDSVENERRRTVRKIMTSAEEDLMALALYTRPHTNSWLYLSPRLCTLGEDAFEHAPAVIKEIRTIRRYLGWNGSRMDAILPVNMLPECLPEPDRELCQGYPETTDRPGISIVRDIWSRELREGTCKSLHPSFGRPGIGRTPHPDCDDVWSVERFAHAIALPKATSENES